MSQLAVRSSQPLTQRLTDARPAWVRDGALVGGVGAYAGAASVAFGLSLHPWLLGCTAAGIAVGGLLGYLAPTLLNRTRGLLPLPVLAVLAPAFAGMLAVGVGSAAAWAIGAPIALAAAYSCVAATLLTAIFWLPYTVATAMDLRRWPVVATACLVSPVSGTLTAFLWNVL